jgi:hypothetical protein
MHGTVAAMAHPPRFERGTCGLEGRCSIQLSYGCRVRFGARVGREAGRVYTGFGSWAQPGIGQGLPGGLLACRALSSRRQPGFSENARLELGLAPDGDVRAPALRRRRRGF